VLYALNSTQTSLRDRARTLAAGPLRQHARDVDVKGRFPEESVAALGGELLGLCVPRELGGSGEGLGSSAAVAEELAQGCSSTAMIFVMHVSALQAIVASTTLAKKTEILAAIARGTHLTTLALSEKGSRSQFWAPVSQLAQSNGHLQVSAEKSWVTSAGHADSYVADAQQPGAASPLESTLFLVRRNDPAVRIRGAFDGLGLRGNDSAPVTFERVGVRTEDLLTPQGEGATAMLQVILPWFSVGTAAMAIGLCRAALAATAAHLQGASFAHRRRAARSADAARAAGRHERANRAGRGAPGRDDRDRGARRGGSAALRPAGAARGDRGSRRHHRSGDEGLRRRRLFAPHGSRAAVPRRTRRLGDGADG
jgi:alkylation response protein AidB-like acyl-CoA dehydrogenase